MAATTISVAAASRAIAQNLVALIERMGWSVVESDDAMLHLIVEADTLTLQRGDHVRQFHYPIRPQALLAAMTDALASAHISLMTLDHGWIFNRVLRVLVSDGAALEQLLTEKEALLLAALLEASPSAVSRETLLREVWSYEADIETHTLETHIYRLRQKLEALHPRPCDIETIEGAYRLVLQASV
jgi:quinol monooxygenase YgiN